ncbi:MAG: nucleotidyltransferase family protein [Clostridiales bacterium]
MEEKNIGAVVMASGFSRRLGTNKLLMPLDEKTRVIDRVLDRIKEMDYAAVAVVSQYEEVLELACRQGFKAVANAEALEGKSSSIRLGVATLEAMVDSGESPPLDGMIFFTGDQALLTKELLAALKAAFQEEPDKIVFPAYDGKPGSPAIFPMDMAGRLKELQGEEGGMRAAFEQKERIHYLPAGASWQGWDLDILEDWEKIKLFYCNLSREPLK